MMEAEATTNISETPNIQNPQEKRSKSMESLKPGNTDW
jgi:hypothetical protein